MPELLTKHPEVALKVLKDANINCGNGALQKILKDCPPSHFCSLPSGELCIYGVKDFATMSQLGMSDFIFTPLNSIFFIIVLLAAFALGTVAAQRKK